MHPLVLLTLAVVTPFVLSATLFAPPYAGIAAASYIIYDTGATNPLTDRLTDVFYIIDVYSKLFSHWQGHRDALSLTGYTIPLLALPLFGTAIGLWLTRKVVRRLRDMFLMSAS